MMIWLAGMARVAADKPIDAEASHPKLSSAVLVYQCPEYLEGGIYTQGAGTKQLLFRFKRVARRSGSTLNVDRDFTYPDGRLAAREHVVYHGDSLATYELDELQIGARGSATVQPESEGKTVIEFQYSPSSLQPTKTRTESLVGAALIADMVGPFLCGHWDSLMRGEKVKCRYMVVPRRETVGFTFTRSGEGRLDNERTITVKMEPTSTVIGLLVHPLFFTVQMASPHRVLRYVGRTTPKLEVGHKWEDLDAVTVFDWQTAH